MPHVLFISGAIGLGHVTRDLAIARALRGLIPDIRVEWLAADAARDVIRDAGETLLPESARYTTGMGVVEASADGLVHNLADLGQEVSYPPVPTGGAGRAAELLAQRLAPRAG